MICHYIHLTPPPCKYYIFLEMLAKMQLNDDDLCNHDQHQYHHDYQCLPSNIGRFLIGSLLITQSIIFFLIAGKIMSNEDDHSHNDHHH